MRRRVLSTAAVLVLVPALGAVSPAAAAEHASTHGGSGKHAKRTTPQPDPLVFTADADVALQDDRGNTLGTQSFGPESQDQWLAPGDAAGPTGSTGTDGPDSPVGPVESISGTEGSSSASGCGTVTVHNVAHTLLGFTAYHFDTWTHWCWRRATHRVYDVDTGWRIHDVSSQQYWQGMVSKRLRFFSWIDGEPHSGYLHVRQGQFENCVLRYGCVSTTYPENAIRTRSNGTWYWHAVGT